MRVRYTLPALADLADILDYVGDRSPQGAGRIAASIQAVEHLLTRYPQSGRRTRLAWLRRIKTSSYPYLIFYEIAVDEVIIHAVRHSARDPSSMPGSA